MKIVKKIRQRICSFFSSGNIGCKKDYFCATDVRTYKVKFGHKCNVAYGADLGDASIGKYTSVGRYTTIRNSKIGNFCSISYNVSIGALGHPMDRVSGSAAFFQPKFGLCKTKEVIEHRNTVVGHGAWIGCNAVIIEGVNIGNGAIVGAGAVVTKDVEPYSVVVGVPARHIKFRFEEEIIRNLEASQWWTMSDEFFRENLSLFSESVDLVISKKLSIRCEEEYNENSIVIGSVEKRR